MLHRTIKNALLIVAITTGAILLWNVTFIVDWLWQLTLDSIIQRFASLAINMSWTWYPPLKHVTFVGLIIALSWILLRSKLPLLVKAIYLTVPVTVTLVTIGILLYRWPIIAYMIGTILTLSTLFYLYWYKLTWHYYYAVLFVAVSLAVFTLLGGEI